MPEGDERSVVFKNTRRMDQKPKLGDAGALNYGYGATKRDEEMMKSGISFAEQLNVTNPKTLWSSYKHQAQSFLEGVGKNPLGFAGAVSLWSVANKKGIDLRPTSIGFETKYGKLMLGETSNNTFGAKMNFSTDIVGKIEKILGGSKF